MNGINDIASSGNSGRHDKCAPEAFGWRRRPQLDEQSREAWELQDGRLLLLDPSGLSDSLLKPKASE